MMNFVNVVVSGMPIDSALNNVVVALLPIPTLRLLFATLALAQNVSAL